MKEENTIRRPIEIIVDNLPNRFGFRSFIQEKPIYRRRLVIKDYISERLRMAFVAYLANNPGGIEGLIKSINIELNKKTLIDDIIKESNTNPEIFLGIKKYRRNPQDNKIEIRFTLQDLRTAAKKYGKNEYARSLSGYKIAKRHLEAEVRAGHLRKDENEYIWEGYWPSPCALLDLLGKSLKDIGINLDHDWIKQ